MSSQTKQDFAAGVCTIGTIQYRYTVYGIRYTVYMYGMCTLPCARRPAAAPPSRPGCCPALAAQECQLQTPPTALPPHPPVCNRMALRSPPYLPLCSKGGAIQVER